VGVLPMGVLGVLGARTASDVSDIPIANEPAFIGPSERWQMLGTLGRMVEQGSALERCQSRPMAVWNTVLGAISSATYRDSSVFIPCGRSIRGELKLSQPATFKAVSNSLSRGIPAFVLKGKLQQVTDFFRLDPTPDVRVILANSGLFVCFGTLDGQDVVAYATNFPQYRCSIEHQFTGIGVGQRALGPLAPEVILKGVDRMIVSRLPGTPVRIKNLTEDALQKVIMKGLDPLIHIYSNSPGAKGGGDQKLIDNTLTFLRNHPHASKIPGACEYLSTWNRASLSAVPVHGDYWADNLLLQNDQVSGVVDWDRSRDLGCVGFDALTLGFMSYAMWGRVYVSDVLADIWRPKEQWHYPWLHEYTEVVRKAFSLTQDDVKGVAVLLWMSTLMFNKDNHDQGFINAMYRPIFQT
jgi:Phosphotransferase enzyme family